MASPLIKMYVAIRSMKETQKQLDEILYFYEKSTNIGGNRIRFSFLAFYPNILEANSVIKNRIYISAEWAAVRIINNDEITRNAFKITIGHELAHKDGDFKIRGTKINRKFISWVTEVHHDFSAAEKMVNSNKERLLASIDYKINAKPNNEAGQTHPSWKQRKVYAETGLFNEKLIRIIASDVGCADEDLIKNVIDYYYDINLK